MIKLENLTKHFSQKHGQTFKAVDNVNLNVPEGEMCVLLGPSGCGKTTTLKMINRLITPSSGTILINGEDTSGMDTVTLRRNIGYVIQQIGLFPNMTIEENITVVPRMLGWDKARCKTRAEELMDMVALDPHKFLNRYPREMSGGQQQRVGVARALAADPEVLLMDEPFGALDPVTREALQQEMLRIHRLLGRTIVLVTHDIDEALRLADHLVLMDGGEVVQQGAPLEMLLRPKNSFVQTFFGRSELGVRLLSLREVRDYLRPDERLAGEGLTVTMTLREALSQFVARRCEALPVVDAEGQPCGTLHFADLLRQEASHEGAS